MKKKLLIIVVSLVIFAGLCTLGWFLFVNFAGGYMINTLVEGIDESTINDLQKAIDEVELQESAEKTEEKEEIVDNASLNSQNNSSAQAQPKSAPPKISYDDKAEAIRMVSSKFSAAEISMYKDRYYKEGITSALLSEVKAKLKARCTPAEIKQIKEWYNKYK